MPIPERTLTRWSHHKAGTAFKQAHVPIRDALPAYDWPSDIKYQVFLQGLYKNDTNLGGDSASRFLQTPPRDDALALR